MNSGSQERERERPSATILLVRIPGNHADNAPAIINGALETNDTDGNGLHIADTKWYLWKNDNGTFSVSECDTKNGTFSCSRERVGIYTTNPIFTKKEGNGPSEIVSVEHQEDGTFGINDTSLHYNTSNDMWRGTECTKSTPQGSTGPSENQIPGDVCHLLGWYVATHSPQGSSFASGSLVGSSVHRLNGAFK